MDNSGDNSPEFCFATDRATQPNRWKCTQTVPAKLKTIAGHLKAKRLELHLFQSDMVRQVGVEKTSVQNWERGIYQPVPRYYPAIIRFLGYVPFKHDGSIGGKTRWLRMCAGWNQEELAAAVGCNEVTVWRWETNQPFEKRRWSRGIAALGRRL